MIFEKFYNEAEEYKQNNPIEMVKIEPIKNPMFNSSVLVEDIKNINRMSKEEILKYVKYHFNDILNNAIEKHSKYDIIAFMNIDLLNAILKLVETNQVTIQYYDAIKFNNLIYEYISDNAIDKNQNILDILFSISEIINRFWVPKLRGLGLSRTLANILAIARLSTIEMDVYVKKVDFIIANQPSSIMTIDMITKIFRILYNTEFSSEFGRIFCYFMKDVYYINDKDPEAEEIKKVNNNMNYAALEILNELPEAILNGTLEDYANTFVLFSSINIRFSMQRLPEEFDRINKAIVNLRYALNCIVP